MRLVHIEIMFNVEIIYIKTTKAK